LKNGSDTDTTNKIPVLCLFGPTASGKTGLAAEVLGGRAELISADSMQVYKGMDIGTAKPSLETRKIIRHHLIDIKTPAEQFSAGAFVSEAQKLIPEIYSRGKLPLVSGGTAFYFKNLLEGLPEVPPSDPYFRKKLLEEAEEKGLPYLYDIVYRKDPEYAAKIGGSDRNRIIRAVEIIRTTDRPVSSFSINTAKTLNFSPLVIGLNRERTELYSRINLRVERMFEDGLYDEFVRLKAAGFTEKDPGMKAIGYREFFLLDCNYSMDAVKEKIKTASRNYAKRQLTFFKALNNVIWLDMSDEKAAAARLEQLIAAVYS
jgi:tRNA dimethylallyltransferase